MKPDGKRLLDLALLVPALLIAVPIIAVVALLVLADSGRPVFFRQRRVGRGGVPFQILKFRTMRPDSERSGLLTTGDDDRVTRLGRRLRRLKLDELPQLWNVLRGDMSFVGPRPEVERYVALYPPELKARILALRPGITDLASIEFRNESDLMRNGDPERIYVEHILPAKLAYYARYCEERSLRMDLAIIFKTIVKVAFN